MVYIKNRGSSIKQMAYAKALLGGRGTSKKQIALDVGYSPTTANSIVDHIENKPGFHNAMTILAKESNNLALAAMEEFKCRGFKEFSNKDLVGALNAIGQAWSKFNATPKDPNQYSSSNKLRTIVMQRVENQTINKINNSGEKEVFTSTESSPVVEASPEIVNEGNGVEDEF